VSLAEIEADPICFQAKYVDKNDFLSVVVREKKKFENALDESVASGLNAGLNILMTQAEYVLHNQQDPRDFCPELYSTDTLDKRRGSAVSIASNNSTVLDIEGPTKAAQAVVECLKSHCDMLKGSTDKAILEVFHQEVALRLHG
jgi:recyclin-1